LRQRSALFSVTLRQQALAVLVAAVGGAVAAEIAIGCTTPVAGRDYRRSKGSRMSTAAVSVLY
jgi:hypothetical protein